MKTVACLISLILSLVSSNLYAQDTPAEAPKFNIKTNAYLDKMFIPTLYTCDGKNVSPQLSWADAPAKTASYAVVMSDTDTPSGVIYHWVLYNIPASITSLDEGTTKPAGANEGKNSFDKIGYTGPCPEKGAAHDYIIHVYALDAKLNVPNNADAKTVLSAMKNHILSQADLAGTYSRWIQ